MGLMRKPKVEKPEVMEEAVEEEVMEMEASQPEPKPEPKPETKAPVKREPAGCIVKSDGKIIHLTELRDKFDPLSVNNTFARIVGASGSLMEKNNNTSFGEYIDIQVLSFSNRWMVTPDAEISDKKARKLCRASLDGKTIPGLDGEPDISIAEWQREIEAAGYDCNPVSKYLDIYAIIFNAAKNLDIASELGIVQVSVSPTSVKGFTNFAMQVPIFIKFGKVVVGKHHCVRVSAKAITGDYDYTKTEFGPVPLDVIEGYEQIDLSE
jgi:hypothetical protein